MNKDNYSFWKDSSSKIAKPELVVPVVPAVPVVLFTVVLPVGSFLVVFRGLFQVVASWVFSLAFSFSVGKFFQLVAMATINILKNHWKLPGTDGPFSFSEEKSLSTNISKLPFELLALLLVVFFVGSAFPLFAVVLLLPLAIYFTLISIHFFKIIFIIN